MVTLSDANGIFGALNYKRINAEMLKDVANRYRSSAAKTSKGYVYIRNESDPKQNLSSDQTTMSIISGDLISAVIVSLVSEEWTSDCEKALNMYLDARAEFIDQHRDPKKLEFLINNNLRLVRSCSHRVGFGGALKQLLAYYVAKAHADANLVDVMLSDDNIAKSLNHLLLADDATVIRYAKSAGELIDSFIESQKLASEKSNDTELEDNDLDEDQNVIDVDFSSMLAKYNMEAINTSIIQYYQAIQQWTGELMDKLDDCEQKMEPLIRDFNQISLKLSKKYEDNPLLTDEENSLLSGRQLYLQKNFSLGLNNAKSKILAVRKQADDLETRIDEIDNGEDSIHELALLEKEERASFSFLAENTARIIKNALQKIRYFQDNRQFIANVIEIWETWSDEYRIFKTTCRENLKAGCEGDGIEEEIWGKWYGDWQKIRLSIEQKVQPMIERGLKALIPTITESDVSVPEQALHILADYKHMVDQFFLEDRKGIYQKSAFQPGGELQDKFETESGLYKCTVSLQSALQEVIFNCENAEDRIFILKWASSLLDIQIDEILDFVADKDLQQLSGALLSEFATLKQKNFDVYLTDAEAYSKEKARREKEYNSLVFKMRKDLMK